MGQTATQTWYDLLNNSQKKDLNTIRDRIFSSGLELIETRPGDRVIEILESWLLETSARQLAPENIQRNIIQKAASFFDFNEVDDAIYDTLHKEICVLVEGQFRRFIRIHHSRFELLHNPESTASNSHGYIHRWQQRVIDGYKEKGKGG